MYAYNAGGWKEKQVPNQGKEKLIGSMERSDYHQTWRQLLGQLLEDRQQRKRITQGVNVQPLTLKRWVSGESTPRDDNIRMLLKVVPADISHTFASLVVRDFPHLFEPETASMSLATVPPAEFYARMLSAYAQTGPTLHPQTMYTLLLQQMILHLDPARQGMAANVVRCMPPRSGQKVRSLQIIEGIGTPPWSPEGVGQRTLFLGIESACGAAVTQGRMIMVASRDREASLYPVRWTIYEQSLVASPILCRTRIAGCLLISSARPYFFTDAHLTLIEHYTHLATLTFERNEFYDLKDIQLHPMPESVVQEPYFHDFNRRVLQKVTEATARQRSLSLPQAQEQVWQDIEEELLQRSTPRP
ncbi:MAG: GAF domain-containing protein [Ktedonobacteraceae bacterium]|nr:GAF domain-containing protein [Ktedonobacteraceae bacterium]